jgi:hypothetical protein
MGNVSALPAFAAQFHTAAGQCEIRRPRQLAQNGRGFGVAAFLYNAASVTYHENCLAMALGIVMAASHEGVDALNPMHQPLRQKFLQSTVNLQGRLDALLPQLIENVIGGERARRFFQCVQNESLVARQFAVVVGMVHRTFSKFAVRNMLIA